MFDNRSDYASNKKDRDSIVYKGVDGNEERITRENFSSEEEFLFWKSWSDEDYKRTDYANTYYHRHIVGLDAIGSSLITVPSPEEMLILKTERIEHMHQAKEMVKEIAALLTKVQFRRLWLHFALGTNVRSIAQKEGVVHSCIVESITSAQKKISIIREEYPTKTE